MLHYIKKNHTSPYSMMISVSYLDIPSERRTHISLREMKITDRQVCTLDENREVAPRTSRQVLDLQKSSMINIGYTELFHNHIHHSCHRALCQGPSSRPPRISSFLRLPGCCPDRHTHLLAQVETQREAQIRRAPQSIRLRACSRWRVVLLKALCR